MTEDPNRQVVPSQGGVFNNLALRIKLILRLMSDSRVNPLLKLLPIGALIYLVIPEPLPAVDDVAVMWLGTYLFVELCPPEVVEEHMLALRSQPLPGTWWEGSDPTSPNDPNEDVIEGEFWENKS